MADTIQVAAFESGQLHLLASGVKTREVVLALPLNRLIVRMVKVPPGEDPVAYATPILQALSPFPDEPLTVSCELVRETASGQVMLAAAMPEGAAEDFGDLLVAAKLQVTRVDALIIGLLRGLWTQLGEGEARRLLAVRSTAGLSLVILDGDQPSAIRSVMNPTDAAELKREVLLLQLDAEDFGGVRPLAETVVVTVGDGEGLPVVPMDVFEDVGAVRELAVGTDAALVGVAERTLDPSALNALPVSWAEVLAESRFKLKLFRQMAVAGGLWLLIMAVLLGVPVVYDFMTDRQRDLSRQHARAYREVQRMKEKVDLVQKYSDHSQGALETLKAISDSLAESGVTLTSWNFKRQDSLQFSGEADTATLVYDLKNELDERFESAEVKLNGPSSAKDGKLQRFSISIDFKPSEEES